MKITFEGYNFQSGNVEERVREIDEREVLNHNALFKKLARNSDAPVYQKLKFGPELK